jgi:hypothetical protein
MTSGISGMTYHMSAVNRRLELDNYNTWLSVHSYLSVLTGYLQDILGSAEEEGSRTSFFRASQRTMK